ncbi:GNAT family N-acetyltransferase [Kingella negevensis]|uniref:Putative phosphinothricin acetyltransferase YwnH n=1 Tax=Kingella negevensis TaxID=1522312 RepID=A0A238T932_9NEIS|nr:GNAT family N-acetyltransferase [Kingella negevensis]MDK4680349.1 GNAT family N-acetyltransferase [Kingella negevensis]MDK4681930.1 GNAT family N-acetyltransferase [Kingella negevensis]MDK4684766.1 GNAT family N-acetyltransferase [Kingella negevensis]MDK4688706.1 GNAT family N-acetyltransferase [Kingella negevensis]MDK4690126.1 GNAT family N-acetyltransferase [Kingella negevensis]
MILSLATREELPEIVSIYNSTVASRQVTADLQPVTVAQREAWFQAHQRKNRPLYVLKDVSGCVIAWSSFSDYYPRAAYDRTAEISIYVHEQQRGKGLGRLVLTQMLERAPQLGIHKITAVIFAHNQPSLSLFEQFGFEQWGFLPQVCEWDNVLADIIILGKTV